MTPEGTPETEAALSDDDGTDRRPSPLVLRRHHDVLTAAHDPGTYSNAVSRFLQVPNGLDGRAHLAARQLLDPFFAPERMIDLEPVLVDVAEDLVAQLPLEVGVDAVGDIGARFAVRAQSAWLGWPADMERELLDWMDEDSRATRSGDLARTTWAAEQFDTIIRRLVADRRRPDAPHDVTTELVRLRDQDGDPLSTEVLVSVLRNWTGGDLGSMALATGVVVHWLATRPEQQEGLRSASSDDLEAAIDEILRLDDPFVSNRRVATTDTSLSGCPVRAGQQVVLDWRAANRDPEVFGDPERFDPAAHAAYNLVYGTGPHACPGRPLATLELRVLTQALLQKGRLVPGHEPPRRERSPLGGFGRVPVRMLPR